MPRYGAKPAAALTSAPLPALPSLALSAPSGDDWIHEIKFDGYRMIASLDHGVVRITSRNGKDWTKKLADLARQLILLPVSKAVLDGELIFLDQDGRSSFSSLQEALASGKTNTLIYQVFDLLHLDGASLTDLPLIERKQMLSAVLARTKSPCAPYIRYTDHVAGDGPAFAQQACLHGLEGIISKQASSPYRGGRVKSWLKIKCALRAKFLVIGYTRAGGLGRGVGSLLLAARSGDALVYVGRCGTGFSRMVSAQLEAHLSTLAIDECPINLPEPRSGVYWTRPEAAVDVQFAEWTRGHRLRHPSFLRLDLQPSYNDVRLPDHLRK